MAGPERASQSVPPATPSGTLAGNLPTWVLGGAFLGILAGLTFGPRAAVRQPVGIAYSMMLESVVYPYILSSLIGGLSGLARVRTKRLFQASWAVYLSLWILALAAIFILAQAIPPPPPPVEMI